MSITLQEVDQELVARGFGGFSPNERHRYINWGYATIAKEAQWSWEKKTETLTFNPGEFRQEVGPTWSGTLLVVGTSSGQRKKLPPISESQFLEDWYATDLSDASNRAEPESYFVWSEDGSNYLYLLPAPESVRTVSHVFSQKVAPLTADDNVPITPPELDEAILLATVVRCHIRANEWDLASNVRGMLEEQFDLQLNLDELGMDEGIERVEPYPWP